MDLDGCCFWENGRYPIDRTGRRLVLYLMSYLLHRHTDIQKLKTYRETQGKTWPR